MAILLLVMGIIIVKEAILPYSHKLKRIILHEFKTRYPHDFRHLTQTEFVGIDKDSGVQFYFNGDPDSILCFAWSKPIHESQLLEMICDFLELEDFSQEVTLQGDVNNIHASIRTLTLNQDKASQVVLRSPRGFFEFHISAGTAIAHSFLLEIKEIYSMETE